MKVESMNEEQQYISNYEVRYDPELVALGSLVKSPAMLRTLVRHGITNPFALANMPMAALQNLKIPPSAMLGLMLAAQEYCASYPFTRNGLELLGQERSWTRLTTGCKELDELLGGGLRTSKLYELYGREGVGKTLFLHQLTCLAALPIAEGGLGAGTLFIDAEETFNMTWLDRLATRFALDPALVAQMTLKVSPTTSDQLLYFCEQQAEKLAVVHGVRLFCLDALATHFLSDFGPEPFLIAECFHKVTRILRALQTAAEAVDGVVIFTNDAVELMADLRASSQVFKRCRLGQRSEVCLELRVKPPTADHLREFRIERAPDLAQKSCELKLGAEGFVTIDSKRHRAAD